VVFTGGSSTSTPWRRRGARNESNDGITGAAGDSSSSGTGSGSIAGTATWLHGQLSAGLGRLPGATLAVRVWESSTAFGGYTASL
jgi:hypothetical protein